MNLWIVRPPFPSIIFHYIFHSFWTSHFYLIFHKMSNKTNPIVSAHDCIFIWGHFSGWKQQKMVMLFTICVNVWNTWYFMEKPWLMQLMNTEAFWSGVKKISLSKCEYFWIFVNDFFFILYKWCTIVKSVCDIVRENYISFGICKWIEVIF